MSGTAATVGRFLKTQNIPQEFFAGVTGLSTGALSEFLSGKRLLSISDEQKCSDAARVIEELIKRADPLPLNFHPRAAGRFKKILQDFDKKLLLVSVVSLNVGTTVSDEAAITAQHLDKLMVGDSTTGLDVLAGVTEKKEVVEEKQNERTEATAA